MISKNHRVLILMALKALNLMFFAFKGFGVTGYSIKKWVLTLPHASFLQSFLKR